MGRVENIGDNLVYSVEKFRFNEIARSAYSYALISCAFTINRMNIDGLDKRVANITKGKLAEDLLKNFNSENDLNIDFDSCETPFYQIDRRDFLWRDFEWDLKNNFLTHYQLEIDENTLNNLPCLVPNRKNGDQWDKRGKQYFKSPKGVAFMFSYMIGRLVNGPLENQLINVNLSKDQKQFLGALNEKYKGKSFQKAPFKASEFWTKWDEIDIPELHNSFEIGFNSPIFFTAVANAADWKKFKNTLPKSFCGGLIKTRIQNQSISVDKLRSFRSILPF